MRVLMYYNNNDVRIEEMPKPKIGHDELLVKVHASGICGSDVMEWYRIKKAPLVLGHEIAGEIVEAGKNVKGYNIGDRVFVSHHVPCNTCYYCLNGNHTLCETLRSTNFDPGGFSEFVRVPKINVDRGVFLLPDEMSYEQATFIEPLACVIRGQRIANFKPGQTVLILGSGMSGLLHLLLARALGAGKVIITDINEYRLDMARKLGADKVIHANELNNSRFADLVIICTASTGAFDQALKSVDKGGTVLFYALKEPGVILPLPVNEFWCNQIKLISTYANSPYDASMAIELISSKRIIVDKLVTHKLQFDKASFGFKLMTEAKESMKIIFNPFGKKHEI